MLRQAIMAPVNLLLTSYTENIWDKQVDSYIKDDKPQEHRENTILSLLVVYYY
jgi:hypothetical protein